MTNLKLKLTVAGVIFACAIGYLAFAGADQGWVYTLSVDHYLADVAKQHDRVRLCGLVGDKDLAVQKAQLTARFMLKGDKAEIPVVYHGVVPDLFKPGAEVLVEGKRDSQGVFESDVLMTKCASKYETAPQGHPTDKARALTQPAQPAGGGA